jgi:hypothetical protein
LRFWAVDGQPFYNPVREGLPTIRQNHRARVRPLERCFYAATCANSSYCKVFAMK